MIPVSVVVPAYNAEHFLEATLRTVHEQTCAPAEIIVVDDASTDRTRAIAEAAGARVITHAENGGPARARNTGVAAASAPWIAFIDADDAWLPDKLAAQWAAVQRWPDAPFCFTDYATVSDDTPGPSSRFTDPAYMHIDRSATAAEGVRFEGASFARGLVRSMFIRQSSILAKREVLLASGGYDEEFRLAEDYELFLRLLAYGSPVAVERSLVLYRRHGASLSADPYLEAASVDDLYLNILGRAAHYPDAVLAEIPAQRAKLLRRIALFALRRERFAEAGMFLRRLRVLDKTLATLLLLAVHAAFGTRAGRPLYHFVRSAWRARHGPEASTPPRPAVP